MCKLTVGENSLEIFTLVPDPVGNVLVPLAACFVCRERHERLVKLSYFCKWGKSNKSDTEILIVVRIKNCSH